MNLSYLNKNINKCTIYIKQLDLRVVDKNYYNRKISANNLIPKITEIWHLSGTKIKLTLEQTK